MTTRLRFFVHYTLAGKRQPRVIFMHVPKTAGLSTARYILRRVGWRKTGRSADLAEMPWNLPVEQKSIELANRAIFVFGHMSFASIDRLDDSRQNYIFTFLREPKARLWSMYKHLHTYLEKFPLQPSHRSYPVIIRCSRLSPEEFFRTDDREILDIIDNHVVRQFAGRMAGYPVDEAEWPAIFEQAKSNLHRVDFVGFQESFETDLRGVLKEIKIARPRVVPHTNKALDRGSGAADRWPESVDAVMDRLTRWDAAFFDFAVQTRGGAASSRKPLNRRIG